ncbi:MAG: hypothetical protein FWC20_11440, partial [Oscillospiraceae bacterium]|nr:hypothetical protein [Oscillospiraceae bacterium]
YLDLDVIIIIDNHTVAESVANAAERDIIEIVQLLDFQTVSSYHIEQGLTYLGGMRQNLEVLRVALQ